MSLRLKVPLNVSLMYYTHPPIRTHPVYGWAQGSVLPLYDVSGSIFKVLMRSWIVFRCGSLVMFGGICADLLQYAYLSHFYANALSIFLDDTVTLADVSAEHTEALRNLPSFQQ